MTVCDGDGGTQDVQDEDEDVQDVQDEEDGGTHPKLRLSRAKVHSALCLKWSHIIHTCNWRVTYMIQIFDFILYKYDQKSKISNFDKPVIQGVFFTGTPLKS